jgi:hypothetical protein
MEGLLSLVNSTEYAGITVKEWNIIQFSKLSRVLSLVVKEYKDKNIAWEGFSNIIGNSDGGSFAGISTELLNFLSPFLEHAPAIITISCNIDHKKLETINYTDGVVLIFLILKTNLEHLNGFFGKLVAPAAAVETTTSPSA